MNFKKYNFVLAFMIALVIAIPIVKLSSHAETSSGSDLTEELPPVAEVGPSDQTISSSKPSSFKFSTSWQAYNHILTTSLNQSYVAKTSQTLTATAKVGISMSFDQKVECRTYVTKDGKIFEETYSSGTKKFFNTTFFDGANIHTRTVDGEFAIGNQPSVSLDKFGVDEYLDENGVLPAYVMKLNKNCFGSSKPELKNGYYYIKATVNDSSLWKNYLKKVEKMSGSEKFPTMNSVSFQFVYSSKTGKLVRIVMSESYDIKYMGLNVTCNARTTKNFSDVGGDVHLPDMSYMGM